MTVMMPAPINVSSVAVCSVKPVPRTIIAIGRTDDDADANGRNEKHWARWWWRVIVTGRGSAVRLDHICAGIRAQSCSKSEREHNQCHHETFLSHKRRVPPVVSPI